MTFQDRLDSSVQREHTMLELMRMRLLHSPASGISEGDRIELKGLYDRCARVVRPVACRGADARFARSRRAAR